ncbi:hypothetical protein BDQ12DRAFT_734951 [Crucibulum laeve]|uniref:F-box domain-containing protein n=1 Tax=Crucibulum laeve TaxID=68775 RepID=A0A5C3MEN9_9AGAR|nr:hypothetical protein BDQ12DRAFT_734951 [Crucibulum laeve]
MATLLSLAPEILQAIAYKLDGNQNRELRTVCRQLNNALEAIALSTLVIDVNRNTTKASIDRLQAYAAKSTCATTYVHHLEILSLAPTHDPKFPGTWNITYWDGGAWTYAAQSSSLEDIMVEWQLREHLSLALSSLTNTQAVAWYTSFQDPEWVNATVQDFLKTLTGFKHFKVDFHRGLSADLSLECIHDLTKLTVSGLSTLRNRRAIQDQIAGIIAASPAICYLNIDTGVFSSDETSPSLQEFLSRVPKEIVLPITHLNVRCLRVSFDDEVIRHFRSLKSFKIGHNLSKLLIGSTFDQIWNSFQTEHIHLEEIHVNITDISSTLIDYLASYSGLKKISVSNVDLLWYLAIDYEQSASDFYARVMPKHCESLESLELRPTIPGAWCFSDSLSPDFELCQRLKELAVTLDFSASNMDDVDGLNMVKRTTSTHPLLERLTVYVIDDCGRVRELISDSSITTQ